MYRYGPIITKLPKDRLKSCISSLCLEPFISTDGAVHICTESFVHLWTYRYFVRNKAENGLISGEFVHLCIVAVLSFVLCNFFYE